MCGIVQKNTFIKWFLKTIMSVLSVQLGFYAFHFLLAPIFRNKTKNKQAVLGTHSRGATIRLIPSQYLLTPRTQPGVSVAL